MVTRGVEGAYQGALRTFQNPMLALLHQTHAPFVVTVLATVFTAERPRVPVADSHAEIKTPSTSCGPQATATRTTSRCPRETRGNYAGIVVS